MIPKQIYMTYKNSDIPPIIFERWNATNPEYNINFYTDEDCINFLEKYYSKDYADYFKEIEIGMYKADFWRLCVLYEFGGIYTDIDIVPYKTIEEIIGDSMFCTCLSLNKCTIFQAFIATIPKNPLIKKCMESLYSKRFDAEFYKISDAPTVDMYTILKNELNVAKISPNVDYDVMIGKYDIYNIGTSESNIKTIKIKKYNKPEIIICSHVYNDMFDCAIENDNLIVKRIDSDHGWGHNHEVKIYESTNDTLKLRILEEYGDSFWQDNVIKFNDIILLKSRDIKCSPRHNFGANL